jgi:hypothetical protein
MAAEQFRQYQRDVESFVDTLGRFLAVMQQVPSGWANASTWTPKPGREREAAQLRGAVDRVAGRAAHALVAAGSFVEWKPRGTMQTQPVSPAQAWATILDPDPMFGVDVILACCNQALGTLDMKAERAEAGRDRRSPRSRTASVPVWRHLSTLAKALVTTVGAGLVVAYLSFRFGWG